jgi:hypothetical protein
MEITAVAAAGVQFILRDIQKLSTTLRKRGHSAVVSMHDLRAEKSPLRGD